MAKKWPFKDPDELLDYEIKWGERLGDVDTISDSQWTITGPDAVLVKTDQSNDSQNTVIWLRDGTLGATYHITNRISTAAARTMDQTVSLKIKSK